MNNSFRPWGPLEWLLPKLPSGAWGLLGVLGTEDRCTAVLTAMNPQLCARKFLKILDPHLAPESLFDARFAEIQNRLLAEKTTADEIRNVNLLQDIDTMQDEIEDFLKISGPRVVLDITSMPKRWFFPVIRFLIASASVETLIVTYTSAITYGEQLSSDPAALGPLPTFDAPRLSERYDELARISHTG